MRDLLLKALDAAVTDAVLKEYSALVAGLIQEKGAGGDVALQRFRSGMRYAIDAYNQARHELEAMTEPSS